MSRILVLAHRLPYPPDKGEKIRSWHFLRHLCRNHRVDLGCFADEPEDLRHVPVLRDLCGEVQVRLLPRSRLNRRTMAGLLDGSPLSVAHFRDPAMATWVQGLVQRNQPERVLVFSSAMVPYAPPGPPRIIDFVDVDSDKWRQYARSARAPLSWIYRREHQRLLAFDRQAARDAQAILFVAEAEAQLFGALAPEAASRIRVVRNGVDLALFDPGQPWPRPEGFTGQDIVFTGAMDYRANVDAVAWFARAILPMVRRSCPEARFWIVGSAPAPAVRSLAALPHVHVAGRVPDIRPWLGGAAVVIAPLRLARGTQNKVLEGMAMARPVVATSAACRGVAARPGEDLWLADDAVGFADAVVRLLRDPARAAELGRSGRRRVERDHSWPEALAALDAALEHPRLRIPAEV